MALRLTHGIDGGCVQLGHEEILFSGIVYLGEVAALGQSRCLGGGPSLAGDHDFVLFTAIGKLEVLRWNVSRIIESIGRAGACVHFRLVIVTVAVGVSQIRVGSDDSFLGVGQTIAIGICWRRRVVFGRWFGRQLANESSEIRYVRQILGGETGNCLGGGKLQISTGVRFSCQRGKAFRGDRIVRALTNRGRLHHHAKQREACERESESESSGHGVKVVFSNKIKNHSASSKRRNGELVP